MVKKTIPKNVKKEIDDFVRVLRKDNLPIRQIILFGSFAKGTSHRWSDIDICVISPRFRNAWEATRYLWSKRPRDFGLTIEPIGMRPEDLKDATSLSEEIRKTGVRVY